MAATLTVTTGTKDVTISNGIDFTKYIFYGSIVSIDAIGNDRVEFNNHHPSQQQFVRYILKISDIIDFDGVSFTASSIALAIRTKKNLL